MANKKGSKKTGGRKSGSKNKDTKPLREMILGALDNLGGMEYLEKQAVLQPSAFLSLIGKVLPTTLASDKDNPLLLPICQINLSNDSR
tara:strand:- start:2452 stop:2715 length:264 start_codon:yes stop_codon:yes gene_type:complete